jgi:hypothetical protein
MGGAASGWLSTRPVGAGCWRTEPVMSLPPALPCCEACGFDDQGSLLMREKSLLQPATPADNAATSARRETARER